MTPEQKFENGLEIFRTETQTAVQFFYAYLTIHAVARDRPAVHRLLNRAPLFWNTNWARSRPVPSSSSVAFSIKPPGIMWTGS